MEKELKKELKKVEDLAKIIVSGKGLILNQEEKAACQEWQDRLEFRLNELVVRSKIEEAKIKVECMTPIAKIVESATGKKLIKF